MLTKLLLIGSIAAGLLLANGSIPQFIDAVRHKDHAALKALLKQKVDVNGTGPDGATALHWATEMNDTESVRLLLGKGANVKAANQYGVQPLSLACLNGSPSTVALLLEAGADPNTASAEGETVLMTASRAGNAKAVDLLLAKGANVHATEAWRGQTALMWAAGEGHVDVVTSLIKSGADLRVRSNGGFTALLFAVREGKLEVARALLGAGADVNETLPPRERRRTGATGIGPREGGSSALDLAVANGHFELAAALLDAGANPNAAGPGWTALHTITWVRKPGTGSNDPAPQGSGNLTSLDIVRKLVAKGANLNARITKKPTAGLSALNTLGATPFLMAARTADAELMRLFAELGADPLVPTQEKTTPLMVAAGVGTRSPGEDAGAESEVIEAIQVAMELGNDINAVDDNGETAMHGAAYKHLPGAARYLADHGARIEVWNQKNKLGWTPLQIAEGVQRTGNFRRSAPTAAMIRNILGAASSAGTH